MPKFYSLVPQRCHWWQQNKKNNPQKNDPVSERGETLPPLPNPCQKFEKSCVLHGLIVWFVENILVSERGHLPCWPCRREFCSLVPQRCHLWQQKTIENKTIQSLRGVRPPPLFHAKNVWNVVFDMVYGLMVSCHAMLKIIRLHYPKVTLHYVIMLPLVTSSPVPTIPSQFPSYFFLALPHQFGNFAEIGFEPSSYQSHLTHFFPAPVWVTLPTLVLSQLHYIPSSLFFWKLGSQSLEPFWAKVFLSQMCFAIMGWQIHGNGCCSGRGIQS